MREILKKKPADLDWIQKQGLLSVKLAQIFALRSDLIGVEKCRQLQQLYQHAASIPAEDVFANLELRAPDGFFDAFENIEKVPLAAASVGQVHRAKLKTGEEVVVKIIKNQNSKTFRRDVERMRRWLRIFLFFNRKLRRVGNPVALLNHVADYTTRELDLRNEIKGAVDSFLLELVGQRALNDFLVVCDGTNNTSTRIDRNELYVDIAIEPVKSVEFIFIPLRIKNTGEIAKLEN